MKQQKNPTYPDEQFSDHRDLQPEEMTPEQRRREIARLLAVGVLRLHQIRSKCGQDLANPTGENSTDNPAAMP